MRQRRRFRGRVGGVAERVRHPSIHVTLYSLLREVRQFIPSYRVTGRGFFVDACKVQLHVIKQILHFRVTLMYCHLRKTMYRREPIKVPSACIGEQMELYM